MAEEMNPVKEARGKTSMAINPPGLKKLAAEAPPDEPPADDSAEAENTGDEKSLHGLLLRMAKDDEQFTNEASLDELSHLLDGGAQVDAKDADGQTALHLAAGSGLFKAAMMLIKAGANVSEPDSEGRRPLHEACSEGRVELVQVLLDKGADINARQHKKATPLYEACCLGHIEVVNLLLERGADTQITEEDDWTPLHAASRYGHTEVIRALLAKGKTNIDARESLEGWTALHVAIYNGHVDVVSALLEQGANFGIQDNDSWTPLMTATTQKHEYIVEKLLNQKGSLGLETRDKLGHTPLLTASINGFLAGVILLIEAGADCNVQSDRTKATPLIAASCWRYRRIVEALLEGSDRTDINTQDEDGWAALHFASNKGYSKVVELLLHHDANVHLNTDDGQTALHLASKMGNENVVEMLLQAGTKVDARDQDGKTALHLASGAGPEDHSEQNSDELGPDDLRPEEMEKGEFGSGRHDAVVKLLLEWKARSDAKTNKNETALHLAAARGDPTRLDLILASMEQKHMSTRNDQGRTAFYLACTGENPESAVESLLKSDKLRTAEFGRSDGEDDEIKWAAKYPETHEIAKWLMEERLKAKGIAKPEGSDNWSVIEWAAYSRLPEVLSLLITKSPGSSEIQALLTSMLESVLESKPEANKQPANELRDDTEQNKRYEVLSLLIASSTRTPSLKEELKPALKKTLDLALGKGVKQGAGHRRLLQLLSLLIATFSGTSEVNAALKSTLKLIETPEEGTTYEQLSQVLWLLISNSPRTPDIDNALKSAQESISKLVGSTEKRPQDPESVSTQPEAPKAEAGATSHKGKTKDPGTAKLRRGVSRMTVPTAPTTRTGKDKIDYLHAIIDILRDPPFSQTHKDSKIDGPPKHNDKLSNTLEDHEATIVQFYKGEGESGTLRRYRSLKEVIYDHGPGNIMKKTISGLKKILGDRSELAGSIVYLNTEPKFTWVHLPATNIVWMNVRNFPSTAGDTVLRIMNDERYEASSYHELASFFRNSWTQVPDRISPSRSMRPRTVVGCFGAASATYMPYFCFSTQYRDEASLGRGQKKFTDMKTAYEYLNDTKSPVIHESPTLDEWYYQFAPDEESTRDRKRRNATQIVTKAIEGTETTMEGDESPKEGEDDGPSKWTLVRVNQLWAWTIANKWLITATSDLFNVSSNGTLVEGILEQIGKRAASSGSASQPESAADMSRLIVDYCIGSYERLSELEEPNPWEPKHQKHQGQVSIRQIFSNAVNRIGRKEATLFKEFSSKMARWREQVPIDPDKTSPGGSFDGRFNESSQASVYGHIRRAIEKIDLLFGEIKDIRDELNMLKSAAQHQKTVEEGLSGGSLDANLAAAYVLNDLKAMDNSAGKIQSSINTTLSLLQSDSANLQAALSLEETKRSNHLADLAARQAKTLMVFTVVTILFLPLSFLSSLFALDVASFQQAPGWAFAVIFGVSFAFSTITALVALRETIRTHLRNFMSQDDQSNKTKSESSETSGDEAEGRDIVERSLGPHSEPATGNTDSHRQPFLSGLRGRLRRRQSDAV